MRIGLAELVCNVLWDLDVGGHPVTELRRGRRCIAVWSLLQWLQNRPSEDRVMRSYSADHGSVREIVGSERKVEVERDFTQALTTRAAGGLLEFGNWGNGPEFRLSRQHVPIGRVSGARSRPTQIVGIKAHAKPSQCEHHGVELGRRRARAMLGQYRDMATGA